MVFGNQLRGSHLGSRVWHVVPCETHLPGAYLEMSCHALMALMLHDSPLSHTDVSLGLPGLWLGFVCQNTCETMEDWWKRNTKNGQKDRKGSYSDGKQLEGCSAPICYNNRCLLVHNPCILFCQYPQAVI